MRFICIYGPPGAGKTTAAVPLARVLNAAYIASGDIARRVDPGALALGKMADRQLLREGFIQAVLDARFIGHRTVVVDGLPRDPTDCELVPDHATFILLTARPTVLMTRQLHRGRPGDDEPIIKARTEEQLRLMQMGIDDGWAQTLATKTIDTSRLGRSETADVVRLAVQGVPIES